MPDHEKQIQEWRSEMIQAGITRPEVLDEFESHLRGRATCLINSGLPPEEAFQAAVQELGESRTLKQEFSKLNRHRLWIYRDNPLALKILAGWFVVMGVAGLLRILAVWFDVMGLAGLIQLHPVQPFALLGILFRLDSPLQILVGLGLLHRKNVWRFCAFGWAGFNLILYAYALTPAPLNFIYALIEKHPLRDTPLWNAQTQYSLWLGLQAPLPSHPTAYSLELGARLAALTWACVVLARPAVRNLFRRWA